MNLIWKLLKAINLVKDESPSLPPKSARASQPDAMQSEGIPPPFYYITVQYHPGDEWYTKTVENCHDLELTIAQAAEYSTTPGIAVQVCRGDNGKQVWYKSNRW